MNKVILCGRLTRDADIKYITVKDNQSSVARFIVAVNRKYNNQEADFINCIAFGKTAEFIEKYCIKGTKLIIEGEWQTGSYTNKEGAKVYTNECKVDSVEFAESKKTQEENQKADKQQKTEKRETASFMDIPDDLSDEELPFGV